MDDDPHAVFLTLSHPLVARAECPATEVLLASCCPHGAVPSLVRDGIVSLFLPPRERRSASSWPSCCLATPLPRCPGRCVPPSPQARTQAWRWSTWSRAATRCPTTRRVLNATHLLRRVQPRGAVSSSDFLGRGKKQTPDETIDEFYDTDYQSPTLRCCEDLDLSMLSSTELWFRLGTVDVAPKVLRFPAGGPRTMVEDRAFLGKSAARLVFHPNTQYTRIGDTAFCFSHLLTTVDLRGLTNMPSFGTLLFQGCTNLTAVCMRGLPKLEGIGECMFAHCKALAITDCRDCPRLIAASEHCFDGNAAILHVLVDDRRQATAMRDSMADADRIRAVVLTQAQLLHARRSGDPLLHRCPICETDDTALIAAADSSASPDSPAKRTCAVQ